MATSPGSNALGPRPWGRPPPPCARDRQRFPRFPLLVLVRVRKEPLRKAAERAPAPPAVLRELRGRHGAERLAAAVQVLGDEDLQGLVEEDLAVVDQAVEDGYQPWMPLTNR